MVKISIVIPIYNAEDHLQRCVDSVLNQTEKNIEIILVDDGSKDNSIEICKNYLNQDKRVQLIHQENSGVSAARNRGIEQACGEYIGFIDSDDWIEPNMYECLLREANQASADIVICDAKVTDVVARLGETQRLINADCSSKDFEKIMNIPFDTRQFEERIIRIREKSMALLKEALQ